MSRNITTNKTNFADTYKALSGTANGKLLFTKQRGRMCAMLIQEDRLKAIQVLEGSSGKIGAIYIAKVKNVVKNIDACFVEIADGEICFLPFKEATSAFVINRPFDGRLLEGDELLVQVTRDAQKTKQASVTAHISLSNDVFAISLGDSRIGYSTKLTKERKLEIADFLAQHNIQRDGRLLPVAEKEANLSDTLTHSVGLVVRTLAENLTDDELLATWNRLKDQWIKLVKTAPYRTCFSCLVEAPPNFVAVLGQLVYNYEYTEIITDEKALYEKIKAYCEENMPVKKVRLYQDTAFPLSKLYSLENKLDTALKPRIWLKSGGYLVIEPTEALTVIDVNSGKIEGKKGYQETIFKVNQEAAQEIALQLRLRNLSGIIIVDFINMESKEHQQSIMEQLQNAVASDKQKTHVVDMTPLGLVEITRKKSYKPVYEQFSADATYN